MRTTFLKIVCVAYVLVLSCGTVFAAPNFKNAGSTGSLGDVGRQTGLGKQELPTIVGTSINIALSMVGLIFLILTVYAGLLWMTAQGDETKVDKARKIIIAATIGLTVVMSASGITYLVTSRFEQQTSSHKAADDVEIQEATAEREAEGAAAQVTATTGGLIETSGSEE
jgi:hypothetical protein